MASCVRNIRVKNYRNLIIDFQVTVENIGDVFLGHSVVQNDCLHECLELRKKIFIRY